MKAIKSLIFGLLAVAGVWCARATETGLGSLYINGVPVSAGSGSGWTFDVSDGNRNRVIIDAAQKYVITGNYETDGSGVAIDIYANATVVLSNVCYVARGGSAGFLGFFAQESQLVLEGSNTAVARNLHAIYVHNKDNVPRAKLTISGDGELSGLYDKIPCMGCYAWGDLVMNGGYLKGYKSPSNARILRGIGGGILVCPDSSFTMNGGGILECAADDSGGAVYVEENAIFTMNGGTIAGCSTGGDGGGIQVVNGGTVNIFGGSVIGNWARNYGGAIHASSYVNVFGGYFSGNASRKGMPLFDGEGKKRFFNLYGCVVAGYNPAAPDPQTGDCDAVLMDGALPFKVGTDYVVGRNVATHNEWLIGGTYTFNLANAEYVAANLNLAPGYGAEAQGTTPETYLVKQMASEVTVNGENLTKGSGAGWTYANATLTLFEARDYTVTGKSSLPFVIDVTERANVTLTGFSDILDKPGRAAIRVTSVATLTLSGANQIYALDGSPAIAVTKDAWLTLTGSGELVGGKSESANGRCVTVEKLGDFVMEGGTIRNYSATDAGGAIHNSGSVMIVGGSINGCRSSWNGGAIYNGGKLTITGGAVEGNHAVRYGGAIANTTGCYTGILGGRFDGNTAGIASPFLDGYEQREVTGEILGGVWIGSDPTNGNGVKVMEIAAVTQVGDLYVVGRNVTQTDAKLTGGTYTFNPGNAEYVAAGLALQGNMRIVSKGTSPGSAVVTIYPLWAV